MSWWHSLWIKGRGLWALSTPGPAGSLGQVTPHPPQVTCSPAIVTYLTSLRRRASPELLGTPLWGQDSAATLGHFQLLPGSNDRKISSKPSEKVHKILRFFFLLEIFHHGSAISGRDSAGKEFGWVAGTGIMARG